jgi:hypothetical protein
MDVYTLDQVEWAFGVTYSVEQRENLSGCVLSDVVRECEGKTILFPGFPLSLLDVRAARPVFFRSENKGWYEEEPFASVPVEVTWHLLEKTPRPASFGMTWREQQSLIGLGEEVPTAATVAFAAVLHFRCTGKLLFENCYVRTSDVSASGNRVDVGDSSATRFGVSALKHDESAPDLGLALVRKLGTLP